MAAPGSHPQFQCPTRLVLGENAVDGLGELARELPATRVLLVTDPGVAAAGHPDRAQRCLEQAGLTVDRFNDAAENPTEDDVERCRQALDPATDLVIAVGGGSAIDVAKGALFVAAGGGRMRDYRGKGTAKGRLLPLIAVPTTAGTGSEVQSFALITNVDDHGKMACGDPQAAPRIAVLDPTLTVTMPRFVTACTGLDTLAHAVETAVTTARTPMSVTCSTEAFRLVSEHFPRVLEDPNDLAARAGMLHASAWAGIAIENSMLGAAHSLANPLTQRFGVVHGVAVGALLPFVVRFNAEEPGAQAMYAHLARGAALADEQVDDGEAYARLVKRLVTLVELAERTLPAVPESALDDLAAAAATQWTAQFNPRTVTASELRSILEAALR